MPLLTSLFPRPMGVTSGPAAWTPWSPGRARGVEGMQSQEAANDTEKQGASI